MLSPNLSALQIGTVGEQLVRYKLMRWGYEAFIVEQDNEFDLLVLDKQLIRIQVKSSIAPAIGGNSYKFMTSAGSPAHKRAYKEGAIDAFCFVALDIERILFHPLVETKTKRVQPSAFFDDPHKSWMHVLDNLSEKS